MLNDNAVAIGAPTKPSFKGVGASAIEDDVGGIVYDVIMISYLIGKWEEHL